MICQDCGKRPAVVHQEEILDGRRLHVWLCLECAKRRPAGGGPAGSGDDSPEGEGLEKLFGPDSVLGREDALTSFLGRAAARDAHGIDESEACPACGFTFGQLGETSRLGCPTCYETFRAVLMPLLNRLHRHTSHLGKAPRRLAGRTLESEIARRRAALEKAIQTENFEEAARLRDLIGRMEAAASDTRDPDDPFAGGSEANGGPDGAAEPGTDPEERS